jgi:hypothetical protein
MLIVIVTRHDLRDEFAMAEEAFALSPITARATRPSEADYDAIRDAFMETSRGRWFLNEYARRNRNADTRMVLDAVARIEATIATQTQKSVPASELADALAAIRVTVEEGKADAVAEMARLDVTGSLAPAYKDAQTIRKIIWTLRESGTDLRLCDLLDAQANAIETSLDLLAATEPRDAVAAVFDGLLQHLDTFAENNPVSGAAPETGNTQTAVTAAAVDETTVTPSDNEGAPSTVDLSGATAPVPDLSAPLTSAAAAAFDAAAPEIAEEGVAPPDAEAAHDDAVLDLIAMEMAAPDIDEGDTPAIAEPVTVHHAPEPSAPMFQVPQATPSPQPSLGAALLASGTIRRPRPSHSDRFAAIRRMSQAEKVALFS